MEHVWKAKFTGRPVGAVGVDRPCECVVLGQDRAEARAEVFKRFESVHHFTMKLTYCYALFLRGYCHGLIFTASADDEDGRGEIPFPIYPGSSVEIEYPEPIKLLRSKLTSAEWDEILSDTQNFFQDHVETEESIEVDQLEMAGSDFHLTRNGHGCGFWDGDWPDESGERLTKAAETYGSLELFGTPDHVYVTH